MIGISLTIIDSNDSFRVETVAMNEGDCVYIGRNPEINRISVREPFVSDRHGVIICKGNRCFYQDINRSNGSFVNSFNREVRLRHTDRRVLLIDGSTIRIGHPDDTRRQVLIAVSYGRDSSVPACRELGDAPLTVGRSEACDIVINSPNVSRCHCTIYRERGTVYIRDDKSLNGVIVNGKKIDGYAPLKDKTIIQILDNRLIFTGNRIYYGRTARGISISARSIDKWVGKGKNRKQILRDVNVDIGGGEFVAIVGGSGAGKSTLMGALNCFDRKFEGDIYCNNISLKENFNSMKSMIGYVPQEDIIYENLTLEKMLFYTAKLRLPKDMGKAEIAGRVENAIRTLELTEHRNTLIRKMSGGQKKRASIAVELLAGPRLFFLDEPTSGLDLGIEKNLMQSLRDLSRRQECTVVTVTHTTQSLHLCDKVIFMGTGGMLCFSGSLKEAEVFFGTEDITEIYNMISREPERWAFEFRKQNTESRMTVSDDNHEGVKKNKSFGNIVSQLTTSVARYSEITFNDWRRLVLMFAQPLIIGLLLAVVAGDEVFKAYGDTKSMIFALSCAAIWLGIFNTIQEICKERVILKREHMAGLSLTVYMFSKVTVQLIIGLVQALILVLIFVAALGSPEEGLWLSHSSVEIMLTVFITIVAAEMLGLIVSACVRSGDKAMAVAPFILIVQLLFSGILFELKGAGKYLSYVTVSKWSVGALGAISDLNNLEGNINKAEDMFKNVADRMFDDWKIMLIMVAVSLVICIVALKRITRDGR